MECRSNWDVKQIDYDSFSKTINLEKQKRRGKRI